LFNDERWYFYDWGGVRIIVLKSEAMLSQIRGDQVEWLEGVLASTPPCMWKIVCFHRNVYFSGGHGNASDLQAYWVPLFDKYDVDVVFQGHNHHYHRTKPLRGNRIVWEGCLGTVYITTGGWGAPLYDVVPQRYTVYENCTYHFVLVSVFGNGTLLFEAKDPSGYTFDSLKLYKGASVCVLLI